MLKRLNITTDSNELGGRVKKDMRKKILVVEDDAEINLLLTTILTKSKMEATAAYSGTEAILRLEADAYDLILVDLMLPGMPGEELIKQIRAKSNIPIIVISAKTDVMHKVDVLKIGADDYIIKPFNQAEILARVEVQLRKEIPIVQAEANEKVWRDLRINTKKRTASLGSHSLSLTNAEYDILLLFISRPEYAFSKKEIYEQIWTGPYLGDDNTISVHISNIRKKFAEIIPDEYIQTVWGIGFMLV